MGNEHPMIVMETLQHEAPREHQLDVPGLLGRHRLPFNVAQFTDPKSPRRIVQQPRCSANFGGCNS